MSGLVSGAGNPFLESVAGCPNKGIYMFQDLEFRTARYFEVPVKPKEDPITHIGVIGSLAQQRFITAVQQECPDKFEAVCREIWLRSWGPEDQTVHTDEDLRLVSDRAGLSEPAVQACLEGAKAVEVKQALKDTTEEALERGAFGVPTLFFNQHHAREQMIWGSDRFDMVAFLFNKEWKGPNPQ